jgi:hypothetical protein
MLTTSGGMYVQLQRIGFEIVDSLQPEMPLL